MYGKYLILSFPRKKLWEVVYIHIFLSFAEDSVLHAGFIPHYVNRSHANLSDSLLPGLSFYIEPAGAKCEPTFTF